jgi:hypothetical protein
MKNKKWFWDNSMITAISLEINLVKANIYLDNCLTV